MDITQAWTIGEALRLIRQRAGLSRDDLAALSGVATGTVSNIERGATKSPRSGDLARLVEVLSERIGVVPEAFWTELVRLIETDIEVRVAAGVEPSDDNGAIAGKRPPGSGGFTSR